MPDCDRLHADERRVPGCDSAQRRALRLYMRPKVDGAHAMDGRLLEVVGATKRLWQIDVVGILWSPDAATRRLAIVESPQSTWSLPRGRVCAGELHADAFPQALRSCDVVDGVASRSPFRLMAALFGLIGCVRTGCVGAAAGLRPANRGSSPSPGSGRLRGTFLRYAVTAPAPRPYATSSRGVAAVGSPTTSCNRAASSGS